MGNMDKRNRGRKNGGKACSWCREGLEEEEFRGMRDREKHVIPNSGALGALGGF